MTTVRESKAHPFQVIVAAVAGVILLSACGSATDADANKPTILFFEGSIGGGQLVAVSVNGAVRKQLLDVAGAGVIQPRWSPDGGRIAFYRAPFPFPQPTISAGLFVINADGSDLHELAPGHGLQAADWSPDGTQLVAYSGDSLLLVRVSDGALTPLPVNNAIPEDPFRSISWSP